MDTKHKVDDMWRPMCANGEFIVLLLADTFLTHDYTGCLRIAKHDYSYIANSAIFEANILRFLSLASFKAFEHAIHNVKEEELDDDVFIKNFDLLIQALKSSQAALEIY